VVHCKAAYSAQLAAGVKKSPSAGDPGWFEICLYGYFFHSGAKPYVWGGVGPVGYDCSGLVMMAYEAAGISLTRTTFQQIYAGTPVYSFSDLMPGDLLFTPGSDGTAADPGHVGMYIGSGLVIQAPETARTSRSRRSAATGRKTP
jgi:cell wall-associated NlpC family hydrolase